MKICDGEQLVAYIVQFCPWFKLYFPSNLIMIMYDDKLKTNGKLNYKAKDKTEPHHKIMQ